MVGELHFILLVGEFSLCNEYANYVHVGQGRWSLYIQLVRLLELLTYNVMYLVNDWFMIYEYM